MSAIPGDGGELALAVALTATLVTITLTDIERRIIPNRILIVSAVAGAALILLGDREVIGEHAIAAAGAFGFLLLVALACPGGMGMGDVKLVGVMGLYLGFAVVPALLIGFAAGTVYGTVLVARQGFPARKRSLPFGPFLAVGGLVALLAGDGIVSWYAESFFAG